MKYLETFESISFEDAKKDPLIFRKRRKSKQKENKLVKPNEIIQPKRSSLNCTCKRSNFNKSFWSGMGTCSKCKKPI